MSFCTKTPGSLVQFRSFSAAVLFRFLNCIASFQCWGSNSGHWQTYYHPPPHYPTLWCNFRNMNRRLPVAAFCLQWIRQLRGRAQHLSVPLLPASEPSCGIWRVKAMERDRGHWRGQNRISKNTFLPFYLCLLPLITEFIKKLVE